MAAFRSLLGAAVRRASTAAGPTPQFPKRPLNLPPEAAAAVPAKVWEVLEYEKVTRDNLCRGWQISQLASGYRYCADDVLCAHAAVHAAPGAERMLDLGSGVGTVGLLWLGQQSRPTPAAACTLVEAQSMSIALCRETLARHHLEPEVRLIQGDVRDGNLWARLGCGYDVIAANPPYFRENCGALPAQRQRRFCRHELRGGALEFFIAAAGRLSRWGRLCVAHAATREMEVRIALSACCFRVVEKTDIMFRGRVKSQVFVCELTNYGFDPHAPPIQVPEERHTIEVQTKDGRCGEDYVAICKELGMAERAVPPKKDA